MTWAPIKTQSHRNMTINVLSKHLYLGVEQSQSVSIPHMEGGSGKMAC